VERQPKPWLAVLLPRLLLSPSVWWDLLTTKTRWDRIGMRLD